MGLLSYDIVYSIMQSTDVSEKYPDSIFIQRIEPGTFSILIISVIHCTFSTT
jgi:hypothetical protein